MTPDTVHLLAQIIRHQRGLATAVEKWIKSDAFSRDEALVVLQVIRGVLSNYEAQLSRVTVNGVVSRTAQSAHAESPVALPRMHNKGAADDGGITRSRREL